MTNSKLTKTETNNEEVKTKDNDAVKNKDNDAVKNKDNDAVKNKDNDAVKNKDNDAVKNKDNDAVKTTPKKGELTSRKYSTLLEAAFNNGVDFDYLKTEAIKRLKDVISAAYDDIKRLHESKTQVSDFIRLTRAEQSNKVLQISSGSLEQRLGYDRETYTSVTKATTPDEAVIYTLLACIGWDATARLCGIKDESTSKKSKSETGSTVVLNF